METKELVYQNLDYKNLEAIQGLLRFYFSLKAGLDFKPNFELLCVLADICNAIRKSGLTKRQRSVLDFYMKGLTEEEIGLKLGVSQQAINKHIGLICKKLSGYLEDKNE